VVFAELIDKRHYSDVHEELRALVNQYFGTVQSGLQGDSWIWIFEGREKVALDTFTSMKHQVKCRTPGPHVERVIEVLRSAYELAVFDGPEREPHEGA